MMNIFAENVWNNNLYVPQVSGNMVHISPALSSINYFLEHEEKWLKMSDWKSYSSMGDISTLT